MLTAGLANRDRLFFGKKPDVVYNAFFTMELNPPLILFLSFLTGGLIGLERQFNEKGVEGNRKILTSVIGLRTFSLIGTLGGISGLLYETFLPIAGFISLTFFALLILYYREDSTKTHSYGITTELTMVYTYLIGVLIALQIFPIQLIFAITIVLLLLLSRKDHIHNFINHISRNELNAFISYAIVALVILPFLPNQSYALSDIPFVKNLLVTFDFPAEKALQLELFNPFKVWLVVALITGVDILGYILEKTFGQKRGWLLASIAGGFISSTATTQSLAQQSKTAKQVAPLLSAAIISNLASFFQIALVIAAVNSTFFVSLLPTILLLIVSGIATSAFFLLKKEKKTKQKKTIQTVKTHEIFNLAPALKFALIYVTITIVSKLSLEFFGNSAFLVTTALGALAGLDAVMINTAELTGKTIGVQLGVVAFIIANAVNLLAKTVYSFLQGDKSFAVPFGISMLVIIFSSCLGLLFVSFN